MNEQHMKGLALLAEGVAKPIATQLHANSLFSAGTVLYLAEKGIIDLDDYLNYMDDLKERLMQSPDYSQETKDAIEQEFDFYQSKFKK
ncbi:hypothetical protein LU276_05105 [Moraxella haemolytica]|uniref:hypothetical protein n=1 Tax=Moraxella haemolytica TaxID=2904119 RepID=UPI002543A79B|nr:hypothetical protein [Moraxella sp. ZY171148]WII94428.1 hypothetical protein LU276_05105 [Moraxella sp. ZY171148]